MRTIACVTADNTTLVRKATIWDGQNVQPSIVHDNNIIGQHKHRQSSIHTVNGGPDDGGSKHVKWCQTKLIFPARRQSEELYCTVGQDVGIHRNSGGGGIPHHRGAKAD